MKKHKHLLQTTLSLALVACTTDPTTPLEPETRSSPAQTQQTNSSKPTQTTITIPTANQAGSNLSPAQAIIGKNGNRHPVIQFLNANPPATHRKEDIIRFEADAIDPDQDQLKYAWSATKGFILNAQGSQAEWQPLKTDGTIESGLAIVSLIVSDGKGGVGAISSNIRIEASGSTQQETLKPLVPVKEVLVSQAEIVLRQNEERELDATVLLDNGTFNKNLIWVSSDPSILKISEAGKLQRLKSGEASVIAISTEDVTKQKVLRVVETFSQLNPELNNQQNSSLPLPNDIGPNPINPSEPTATQQVIQSASELKINASPVSASLDKNGYHFYKLDLSQLNNGNQVNLILDPQANRDVDLYLSKSPALSKDAYLLRSARSGLDEITFVKTADDQIYYLAVYGFGGGSYTLRAISTSVTESTTPPTNQNTSGTISNNDISVVEKSSFSGIVSDDSQAPLDGVTITAKSLNASVPYTATTTTSAGNYYLLDAPAGVQIEIVATRPGYTTRRRIEVLKSNIPGDPNGNKYDFGINPAGGTGSSANALSDRPEVTQVVPGRNASGVDPATSFVLKFSEPMDRATVSDSFLIRAYTSEQLSVDNGMTYTGSNAITAETGTQVWDKAAFNVSWNSDDSEATFIFKEERKLPSDKDSDKVPDYQLTFSNLTSHTLKDKSGISRASNYFKLTDGNFEQSYKFAIKTDEQKPSLSSLVALTAENAGNDGDALKVRFSERMIHYTLGPTIAGGINGIASQAAGAVTGGTSITGQQAAANYKITVIRGGATTLISQAQWSDLGGRAIFDTTDATHKTVLLLPRSDNYSLTSAGTTTIGDTITASVHYLDGTAAETVNSNIMLGDTYTDVENALAVISTGLSITELSDTDNTVEAADTYRVNLSQAASRASGINAGKTIGRIVLASTGAFSNSKLNAPGNGLVVFSSDASGHSNIYQPGDTIIVEIETTVVDPAGNSVDSSNNAVSANAT